MLLGRVLSHGKGEGETQTQGFTSEAGRPPFTKRVVDYVETLPLPIPNRLQKRGPPRFACETQTQLGKLGTQV